MRWEWLKQPGSGHSGTYQKGKNRFVLFPPNKSHCYRPKFSFKLGWDAVSGCWLDFGFACSWVVGYY